MTLSGPDAFRALQAALSSREDDVSTCLEEPAFERLRKALADPFASALDRAVLLRQGLLYESERRGGEPRAEFEVAEGWDVDWRAIGLRDVTSPGGKRVVAVPWMPPWLPKVARGVDGWAAAEEPVRFDTAGVTGDPFLSRLGFRAYRSRGQRSAARSVLTTPSGATLTVVLATGEGKSLLFQLIDSVGFAGDEPDQRRGVTLVIVPTVALAIDQALATAGTEPRAWQAGMTATNTAILHAIRNGTQGLCFASPEAVCGPMRSSLVEAAKLGALRAIVIDEAHMVDAWGTGFRTEFQALSGVHFELLASAPSDRSPRTICLTATLSESARRTLETLFSGRRFESISAARLRPEPEYWFADATDEVERERRVLEALRHLPRPAILYVTKVAAANEWGRKLRNAGFRRFRVFHGDTAAVDREIILNAWRSSDIDLVVGTSAFGLGINYAHVRSVVHACVPETLDRFYQEVGRGGRDGRGCVSMMIPAFGDFAVAALINNTVTIGLTRGLERWLSMFDGPKKHLGRDTFALRLDVAPSAAPGDIDMIGERSTDWNARVLTLMARANLVRLRGKPDAELGDGQWQSIDLLNHDHRSAETWENLVAPLRQRIADGNSQSLELMRELLEQNLRCPADIFCRIYRDATPVCSRCQLCREGGRKWSPFAPERDQISPWPAVDFSEEIKSILDQNRLIVLIDETGPLAQRRLGEVLIRLVKAGMRNVMLFGTQRPDVEQAVAALCETVAFVTTEASPGLSDLPPGPEAIVVGDDAPLREVHLVPRESGHERLLFVRPECRSPRRPDQLLSAVYNGRQVTLRDLHLRLL